MAERKSPSSKLGAAWRAAERYGCDMSLIECNLQKTVPERIQAHARALTTALALRRAMEQRDAGS